MSAQPRDDPRLGRLGELFHYRWAVPALAEMERAGGEIRFSPLCRRLGIGRESAQRTLRFLVGRGWARRNSGYGHPLRPEYLLTGPGRELGAWALELMDRLARLGLAEAPRRKWTLAVALSLELGADRFGEVQAALPGLTARALTLTLKAMQADGLIEREVADATPPRVRYRLGERGRDLAPWLERLPAA